MKNIHILPTLNESRLHFTKKGMYYLSVDKFIQDDKENYQSVNIYITSDEEIKKSDYFITTKNTVFKRWSEDTDLGLCLLGAKKIILTTDQDLIQYDIQPIDDEFLEWFVKNPSCEKVELMNVYGYAEIIIPKEEPKQETLEEVAERLYPIILEDDGWDKNKQYRDEWIEGTKWQQERSYSEEDMIEFSKFCQTDEFESRVVNKSLLELFEQFKKK